MDTATLERLKQLGACAEAIEFASRYRSPEAAWDACHRVDWLIWYAIKAGVPNQLVVRATCACVRTALKYVPEDEPQPRTLIEMSERWCDGLATLEEVTAAMPVAVIFTHDASNAALYAAYATDDIDYAVDAVATAADAAACAAGFVTPITIHSTSPVAIYYANLARLVREIIPFPKETN